MIHHCPAGQRKMALSAQGTLWGCAIFPHYFMGKDETVDYQKYCFGSVETFIKNPQRIYAEKITNYASLRMDRFSIRDRSCLECEEIEQCWICPLAAALTTGEIGKIPDWSCQGAKLLREQKQLFLDRFKRRSQEIKAKASH
jgi:hypothetical protein